MSSYAEFYRRSLEDRDAFWAEQARLIDWRQPPKTICDERRRRGALRHNRSDRRSNLRSTKFFE